MRKITESMKSIKTACGHIVNAAKWEIRAYKECMAEAEAYWREYPETRPEPFQF